ncbi:MAG: glycosyltransferase family 39 protein [Elusimicrobia bacterium]|nr:glycosyltransferase family 39 protein [Elusimicrobiota bacterium]
MRRQASAGLLALGAVLLFLRLDRPALWQDEAETALRAVSIQRTGLPRMALDGALVTAQPSLARREGNAAGVWTWNTWLPAYLTASSFLIFGQNPFAARLPFALAALLTLWLLPRLFEGEKRPWAAQSGLLLLVLSPAFLLFARQSRYYALAALGTVLVLLAWRRILAGKPHGGLALVLSLLFLLHSSFAFFAIALLALGADAALRGRECLSDRFGGAALATAALSLPVFWYFRVWDRPGNHAYAFVEAFEFLKTFLLWLSLFSMPALLPAAVMLKRRKPLFIFAGFALLCGLASVGALSRAAAAAALLWLAALAAGESAPRGEANMKRLSWLWLAATLGLLSFSAAEPYGRYLMGALPVLAYLGGLWISELAGGRAAPALGLAAAMSAANWAGWLPLKAAALIGAPARPAESVSGMMRRRLRDARLRSDLARFFGELWRGPEGYVESAARAIKAAGGATVYSDADNLSLMFAAGVKPVYADELARLKPDWLLLSPWLRLDPEASGAVAALVSGGGYEAVPIEAPLLLWQNNPDPLFRDFFPRTGALPLLRRKR